MSRPLDQGPHRTSVFAEEQPDPFPSSVDGVPFAATPAAEGLLFLPEWEPDPYRPGQRLKTLFVGVDEWVPMPFHLNGQGRVIAREPWFPAVYEPSQSRIWGPGWASVVFDALDAGAFFNMLSMPNYARVTAETRQQWSRDIFEGALRRVLELPELQRALDAAERVSTSRVDLFEMLREGLAAEGYEL